MKGLLRRLMHDVWPGLFHRPVIDLCEPASKQARAIHLTSGHRGSQSEDRKTNYEGCWKHRLLAAPAVATPAIVKQRMQGRAQLSARANVCMRFQAQPSTFASPSRAYHCSLRLGLYST